MTDQQVINRMETVILDSFPPGTRIAQSHADHIGFVVSWHTSPTQYGNLILPRALLRDRGPRVLDRWETNTRRLAANLNIAA